MIDLIVARSWPRDHLEQLVARSWPRDHLEQLERRRENEKRRPDETRPSQRSSLGSYWNGYVPPARLRYMDCGSEPLRSDFPHAVHWRDHRKLRLQARVLHCPTIDSQRELVPELAG